MNQTTQMHQIAQHLPEYDHSFPPYYCERRLSRLLHPNENVKCASREIHRHAPGALVFTIGSAEEMIPNCDLLLTRFSSTAFVGLAPAR